ncbi:MAG: hypothetical protein Q7J34_05515 [Bacteroidales bacterium]|jgi:hypothetical protein|nr:hypothetical protein [Bacteroidales bacterium]
MMDIFGNKKPVQIELNEWWFNGRIIIKQDDFRLPSWISFSDIENYDFVAIHSTKSEAMQFVEKPLQILPIYRHKVIRRLPNP